jgi:hypothetical protein
MLIENPAGQPACPPVVDYDPANDQPMYVLGTSMSCRM